MAAFTLSDEVEDTKRIVRSAKEKRYEELMNLIHNIRNYKKIKAISSMLTSFEELMRAYTKALPVISKEENGQTRRFYVRCLVEMDDFITEVWKNMSKNNSKFLTSIRQKLRKYTKEFEEDMAKFRANPDHPDEEEEERAHEFDARCLMISKTFYQQLRSRERQSLVGPPESMREHVVAASKAMRNGNWAAC
uniref:Eukaryotic translation initiation factor 3 subunit C N-terminal domain-containing protein n=1 Tax=Timema genevievae TaxID=629358 RepID=A0A7R9K3L5_TIMGE|nr:unnamed protein product [Timema genevievae]